MDKILTIDGKPVGFRATALTPRLYRHRFGRDIVRDMNQLKKAYDKAMAAMKLTPPGEDAPQEAQDAYKEALLDAQLSVLDLEIFEDTAYVMALQYDKAIPGSPEEWLEAFETFSIYEILPEIVGLWGLNQKTTSIPKKIKATVREQTGATFMLRCAELGLTGADLEDMTMGMVFDMLIESGNDREKYPKVADQDDIYRFSGGDLIGEKGSRIDGIVLEIGGDVTGLNKALKSVNESVSKTSSKLSDVERLLKLDPKNVILLEQKQRLLSGAISDNVSKLDTLKESSENVTVNNEKYDEWAKSFAKIKEQTTKAEKELTKLQEEQKKFTEGGDDYNWLQSEIDATREKIEGLGKKAADTFDEMGRPISTEQYDNLQREIVATTESLRKLEIQANSEKFDGISQGAEKVASSAGKISSAMAPATLGIVGLGAAAFNAASDLSESQNKVDVAFENSAGKVKAFAETALESYGLAEGTALDATALFGDMATSMGFTDESAADMAIRLAGLGGDLASFKNIGVDQAMTALNGVFTGETESLKSLGVVMTEDNLLAYALSTGFIDTSKSAQELEKQQLAVEKAMVAYNKAVRKHGEGSLEAREAAMKLTDAQEKLSESGKASLDSLSETEKIQLRYAYVLDATKNAHGDFLRTSDGAANSLRIMQESVKEAAAALGEVLLPLLTPIIQKVTELIQWFTSLDDSQKNILLTVLAIIAAISPVAGLISGIATVVGGIIPIFSTISGAIAIFTGAATTGTAAATGLAGAISFIVSPIGLVIAAVVGAVALIALKGDEIQAILQKLDDWLQGVFAKDWTEVFGPVLGDILNGFFAICKNVWDNIKMLLDGVIDFIRGVFTGDWERAWKGVTEIFHGLFMMLENSVKVPLNGIIGLLNAAISGVNMLIGGLNNMGFDLPDWLGGGSFRINIPSIPSIPYLAKGGILSDGSAVVGEVGPELLTVANGRASVQPLPANDSHLNAQMGGPGGSDPGVLEIVVPVSLDGRVVGEGVYRYVQQRERAYG